MPLSDPVEMIRDQHKKVQGLYKQFQRLNSPMEREELVMAIANDLKAHTTLEEELFYPAVKEAGIEEDVLAEAFEEHHVVETIMEELSELDPAEEEYNARFTVMMENVEHHIEEEEAEILKKMARKLPEDLYVRMERRWTELSAKNTPAKRERLPAQSSEQGGAAARGRHQTTRSQHRGATTKR